MDGFDWGWKCAAVFVAGCTAAISFLQFCLMIRKHTHEKEMAERTAKRECNKINLDQKMTEKQKEIEIQKFKLEIFKHECEMQKHYFTDRLEIERACRDFVTRLFQHDFDSYEDRIKTFSELRRKAEKVFPDLFVSKYMTAILDAGTQYVGAIKHQKDHKRGKEYRSRLIELLIQCDGIFRKYTGVPDVEASVSSL